MNGKRRPPPPPGGCSGPLPSGRLSSPATALPSPARLGRFPTASPVLVGKRKNAVVFTAGSPAESDPLARRLLLQQQSDETPGTSEPRGSPCFFKHPHECSAPSCAKDVKIPPTCGSEVGKWGERCDLHTRWTLNPQEPSSCLSLSGREPWRSVAESCSPALPCRDYNP